MGQNLSKTQKKVINNCFHLNKTKKVREIAKFQTYYYMSEHKETHP